MQWPVGRPEGRVLSAEIEYSRSRYLGYSEALAVVAARFGALGGA